MSTRLLLASVVLLGACDSNVASACAETGCLVSSVVLREGRYVVAGQVDRAYELLRLSRDGVTTYAQWLPPVAAQASGPAVVIIDPYAGIDWTSEAADAHFAALPGAAAGGMFADELGPFYEPGTAGAIVYKLVDADESAAQAFPALLQARLGALVLFGRFYAGADMSSLADQVSLALSFLAARPEVDATRLGVFGISLGGFMAVHGSSRAAAGARPRASVAWAPPVDWAQMQRHVQDELPLLLTDRARLAAIQSFFEPYLRRVRAAAGGVADGTGADYTRLRLADVEAGLHTPLLVMHDTWDTLVPVAQSRALAESGLAVPLWYEHEGDIDWSSFVFDHRQPVEGIGTWTGLLFAHGFLQPRLCADDEDIILPYSASDLAMFVTHARGMQQDGADLSWLASRLADLADARVTVRDVDGALGDLPGSYLVQRLLLDTWGVTVEEAQVRDYLLNGGLPD